MRLAAIVLALGVFASPGLAQESAPADSSAAGSSFLQRISAQAMADSDSNATAQPDSLLDLFAPKAGLLGWLESFDRILGFSWTSGVAQYSGEANFDTQFDLLDGNLKTNWTHTETEYRQQDRSSQSSNFLSTWTGGITDFADLNVSMTRTTLDDVTRFASPGVEDARITNELNNVNLGLDGGGELSQDFRFVWVVAGAGRQDKATNRGTEVSSGLFGGSGSTRWIYDPGRLTRVTARFGYEHLSGQRKLRNRDDDATTVQDTVGTKVDLWLGRLSMNVDFNRISFAEERLDWQRNSLGAVDTTSYDPRFKFDRENERRYLDKLAVSGDLQILSNLDYHADLSRSQQEQSFTLSRQGFLLDERAAWTNRLTLEYLPSATLQLDYMLNEDWTNQRALDDDRFRGRETRRKQDLRFKLRQPVLAASTFELNGQQYLEQLFYEDEQNKSDRDRFLERLEGVLSTEPFRRLSMSLSGIISRQDEINIRTERAGNNREERLFEVRGSYIWKPTEKFTLDQVYRQQILFRDFHLSDDRDEFNKQGQFSTTIKYAPAPGRKQAGALAGAATTEQPNTPTIELGHSLLFRQNGKRARPDLPLDRSYTTTLRRFDHTFTGSVLLPISIWTFRVQGSRGYLINEGGFSGRRTEEDGRLEMAISGDKSFRLGLVSVTVDVRRVLAFGPSLREDARDYWMANSSLTVRF